MTYPERLLSQWKITTTAIKLNSHSPSFTSNLHHVLVQVRRQVDKTMESLWKSFQVDKYKTASTRPNGNLLSSIYQEKYSPDKKPRFHTCSYLTQLCSLYSSFADANMFPNFCNYHRSKAEKCAVLSTTFHNLSLIIMMMMDRSFIFWSAVTM